jgi:hypothetical protein
MSRGGGLGEELLTESSDGGWVDAEGEGFEPTKGDGAFDLDAFSEAAEARFSISANRDRATRRANVQFRLTP